MAPVGPARTDAKNRVVVPDCVVDAGRAATATPQLMPPALATDHAGASATTARSSTAGTAAKLPPPLDSTSCRPADPSSPANAGATAMRSVPARSATDDVDDHRCSPPHAEHSTDTVPAPTPLTPTGTVAVHSLAAESTRPSVPSATAGSAWSPDPDRRSAHSGQARSSSADPSSATLAVPRPRSLMLELPIERGAAPGLPGLP
mmetsp:Transcript_3001/g.12309  ORF Transcript_3001/g.12309 Transcript_3001/m.12309 type:complete len:204 (-) Transcript_3001:547-1158(-)